jgi:hypothetical protein
MQYLSDTDIFPKFPIIEIKPDELGRTDTYDETKILNKILQFSKQEQKMLAKSAHQIAIIGAGGKSYGFVYDDKNEVVNLENIFKSCGIKYKNTVNTKLADDDLTPRRLVRFFRFHIRKFIETTNRPSYLWLKYAPKDDPEMMKICFPGAEHLVENEKQRDFLYKTYGNLDGVQGTKFVSRLERVFIARQLVTFESKGKQIV